MHRLEAAHLLGALAQPQPSVVAAAASTIDDPACRAALAAPGVEVVWLRASPPELAGRFVRRRHRPRFGRRPQALLAGQAARRNPLFASLDPVAIDTEGRRPDDVAAEALVALAAERGKAPPSSDEESGAFG